PRPDRPPKPRAPPTPPQPPLHFKDLLREPAPATPVVRPGTGKPPQVPTLVRINHLRNCRMCHAPSTKATDALRGPVPTPGLPLPAAYYGDRSGPTTIFVRADITYLRQDFSLMQEVEQAKPWPAMQRFDFVIGGRDATPEEMARLEKKEKPATYRQREAVLWALKELTR